MADFIWLDMISRVAKKARESTASRDELIVEAHKDGHSLRTIAEAAGLSHTAIAKIVERTER